MASENKQKLKILPGAVITNPGNSETAKKVSYRNYKPVTDYKKCTKCGKCWMYCPDIAFKHGKDDHFVNIGEFCKGCGLCSQVCPSKCIKMEAVEI